MAHEGETVRVNYARPVPIFPLDSVVLLPHATIRLYIFEARYRHMVSDILDSAGHLAMAVFDGERWRDDYDGSPPVRPAVCIGHLVHHEGMPDGTSKIWIRGLCRARIVEEHEPTDDRPYRTATLAPADDLPSIDTESLADHTIDRLMASLRQDPLGGLSAVRAVLDQITAADGAAAPVSPSAMLDTVSLGVLAGLGDRELLYDLLATASLTDRCAIVLARIDELGGILRRVERQFDAEAPSGVSWN